MRTRTPLLLLILTALMLGSVGSLVALAATSGSAHACSIAEPWADVSPVQDLEPGRQIEIAGYGYADLVWHDSPPPSDPDEPPIAMCDFDLIPQQEIKIVWQGNVTEVLAVVSGPDFKIAVTVPLSAAPGKAQIDIGSHVVGVSVVGGQTLPPDPCPLTVQPDGTAQHWCPEPEPWPCPLYATQPAPDVDVAPGYLPPCPEPCVDYLHTTDDGTTYDYKWDCPDPCGYPQADPGAPTDTSQVWCPPPPEPCNWVLGDAQVCPEPCPLYAHAGDEALFAPCPDPCLSLPNDAGRFAPCPEPCQGQHGEAPDFAPCPDPCYLVGGDAWSCPKPCSAVGGDLDRCPEPCNWVGGDARVCPEPCYLVGGDAWSCPEPCYLVGGDAWSCPDPCPIYAHDTSASAIAPDPDLTIAPCPDPCGFDADTDAIWCPPTLPPTVDVSTVDVSTADTSTVAASTVDASTRVASSTAPRASEAVAAADAAVNAETPAEPTVAVAAVPEPPTPEVRASQSAERPEIEAADSEPVGERPASAPSSTRSEGQPAADLESTAVHVSQRVMRSASAILAALFG